MKNTTITWILAALSTTAFAQGDQKMARERTTRRFCGR